LERQAAHLINRLTATKYYIFSLYILDFIPSRWLIKKFTRVSKEIINETTTTNGNLKNPILYLKTEKKNRPEQRF